MRASAAAVVIAFWAMAAPARAQPSVQYSRVDRATVRIFAIGDIGVVNVPSQGGWSRPFAAPVGGHGSGVLVSADGLVVTAHHVVAGARLLAVSVPGHPAPYPARIVHADHQRDVAILAINGRFDAFVALPGAARDLRIRETVDAIGYPLDPRRVDPQSSRGIVAGVLPDGRIQLSIAVNEGNSGGPLVDAEENLLGVVVARGAPELGIAGVGVAVPLHHVLDAWRAATIAGAALTRASRESMERDRDREHGVAQLVSALVRVGGAGIIREALEVLDRDTRGDLREALRAIRLRDATADVIVLAAAYDWDVAAVGLERAGGVAWPGNLPEGRARALITRYFQRSVSRCREALRRDPTLRVRSPFVRLMIDDVARRLGGAAPAPAPVSAAPATGTLRQVVPPVTSRSEPRVHLWTDASQVSRSDAHALGFGVAVVFDPIAHPGDPTLHFSPLLGVDLATALDPVGMFALGVEGGAVLELGGQIRLRAELFWAPGFASFGREARLYAAAAGARLGIVIGPIALAFATRIAALDGHAYASLGLGLGINF